MRSKQTGLQNTQHSILGVPSPGKSRCMHLGAEHLYNVCDVRTPVKQLISSCNLAQDFCTPYSLFTMSSKHLHSWYNNFFLGYLGIHQLPIFPTVSLVLINLEILKLPFSYNRCIRIFLHKHQTDETSGRKPRTDSAQPYGALDDAKWVQLFQLDFLPRNC